MEVYIEYVIADNFVITALIAVLSYRVLKVDVNRLRVFFCASFGTIVAIFYPFLHFDVFVLLTIKLAIYVVLSLILFAKKGCLVKGAIVFLLITVFFGGTMFMLGYLIYGNATKALTLPIYDFSIGLILLIIIAVYFVLKKLVLAVNKHKNITNCSYKIEFCVFNKTFKANAFLDTGNLLIDDKSGLPVVVLSATLTGRILSPSQIEALLLGKKICPDSRQINVGTIKSSTQILVVKPQKFRLYFASGANTLKEVMLGLSFSRLKGGFEALLSLDIIS